jgi:hypothetical protein
MQFDFAPCHITKGTGSPDFFQIFPDIFFSGVLLYSRRPQATNHQPTTNL